MLSHNAQTSSSISQDRETKIDHRDDEEDNAPTPFMLGDVSMNRVSDVPEDVLILIFSYLDWKDIILNISLVNTTFYNCHRNDAIWKKFIKYPNNINNENDDKSYLEIPSIAKSIIRRRVKERTGSTSLLEIFKYEYLVLYKGWYNFRGYRALDSKEDYSIGSNPFECDFMTNYIDTIKTLDEKSEIVNPNFGYNNFIFQRSTVNPNKLHMATCSHVVKFYNVHLNSEAIFGDDADVVSKFEYVHEWKETYEQRGLLWFIETQHHRIPHLALTGGTSDSIFYTNYYPENNAEDVIKNSRCIPHKHRNGIWSVKIINDKHFVTAGADGIAKIFDVNTESEVQSILCDKNGASTHRSAIYDIDCNPHAKFVDIFMTASADKYVKIFDARSSSLIGSVYTDAYLYEINAQCFDPSSGQYSILTGTDRGFVQMIDFRKVSTSSPVTEGKADPSVIYDMDIFRLGAIRGLMWDGQKIVCGSKLGIVIMTTDSKAQAMTSDALSQAPKIDQFIRPEVMTGNDSTPCPWRVVNFMPYSGIMSLEMDDEILAGVSSNGDVLIGHCPQTHIPFSRRNNFSNNKKSTLKECLVQ
ncbi:hypothetical protein FDP41_001298 [Naegleria fowleri]|uniref:F-box domain-containing protein n=1 Tax=Naegleria fowleri TaxID=5763 RepID=A0A6A5C196_NAEFO|nr:uncharacterized protein FDP41_001298 [Naegleria fowleri]KAF0979630.1 hypothetical protein FDP41_001298 [Naegleria fowleri]